MITLKENGIEDFGRKKLEKKFKMVDITNVGFKLNKSYFSRKGKKHIIFGKGV